MGGKPCWEAVGGVRQEIWKPELDSSCQMGGWTGYSMCWLDEARQQSAL